jgi:hypothetical protein
MSESVRCGAQLPAVARARPSDALRCAQQRLECRAQAYHAICPVNSVCEDEACDRPCPPLRHSHHDSTRRSARTAPARHRPPHPAQTRKNGARRGACAQRVVQGWLWPGRARSRAERAPEATRARAPRTFARRPPAAPRSRPKRSGRRSSRPRSTEYAAAPTRASSGQSQKGVRPCRLRLHSSLRPRANEATGHTRR